MNQNRLLACLAIGVAAILAVVPLPEAEASASAPVKIGGIANAQAVTPNGYVLLKDGTVSHISDKGAVSPVAGATMITTLVEGGGGPAYGLRKNGTILAWGYGGDGALGNGRFRSSSKAVLVKGLANVRQIAPRGSTTYALRSDGTVWAWGYGRQGQLGNGRKQNSAVPVAVHGLTKVTKLFTSGGDYQEDTTAYALQADGNLWAWGYGRRGQLGVGSARDYAVPVRVKGLTYPTQVTGLYGGSTYAVTSDGTVWAWGRTIGTTGDGSADRLRPQRVPGVSGAIAVSAGLSTAYALLSNGQVWSWGWNAAGQLGDGTTTDNPAPAQVPGLADVNSVRANPYAATAVSADGKLWFWGDSGELFTGSDPSSLSPLELDIPTAVASAAEPWALAVDGTVWRWQPLRT